MQKGDLAVDPRGLIREAYRIEGIKPADCRTIFFDWALGLKAGADAEAARAELFAYYAPRYPGHPMTAVLGEGPGPAAGRKRRGRRVRD